MPNFYECFDAADGACQPVTAYSCQLSTHKLDRRPLEWRNGVGDVEHVVSAG